MLAAQGVAGQEIALREIAGREIGAQEVTVREAARLSRRSAETIRRWIWSGRLPARKVGNSYRVDLVHLVRVATVDQGGDTEPVPGAGRLAAWLDGVDRWKHDLPGAGKAQTAADLVLAQRPGLLTEPGQERSGLREEPGQEHSYAGS